MKQVAILTLLALMALPAFAAEEKKAEGKKEGEGS
jgi:hypothetical protein